MIIARAVKTTRTNNLMAFITVEDMYGTVEVIVFPKDYEKNRLLLEEDRKVFIQGRVTVEEDRPAKMICSRIIPFDDLAQSLWLHFGTREEYRKAELWIYQTLAEYDGTDEVNIYLSGERAKSVCRTAIPPVCVHNY